MRKDISLQGTVVASRTQVPLRLAWALSIHKSQGLTLTYVQMAFKGISEYGLIPVDRRQAYVALSRCASLEGLSIQDFNENAIKAHPRVCDFYRTFASAQPEPQPTPVIRPLQPKPQPKPQPQPPVVQGPAPLPLIRRVGVNLADPPRVFTLPNCSPLTTTVVASRVQPTVDKRRPTLPTRTSLSTLLGMAEPSQKRKPELEQPASKKRKEVVIIDDDI